MRRLNFLIFCFSFSHAQWISFNLDSASETNQVKIYLTGISLGFSNHTRVVQEEERRLVTGVSFIYIKNLNKSTFINDRLGGIPIFYGKILISNNLFFQGKLGGFTSRGDISKYAGWGFTLNLSDVNNPSAWKLSTNFSHVKSSGNLRLRSLDVFLSKEWRLKIMWCFVGFGKNYSRTHIYLNSEVIPSVFEGENNYVQFGTQFQSGSLVLVPQIKIHPEIVQISVDLLRGFH